MIGHAFKEWAGICNALANGRQKLILRKGGIAEEGGVFKPDHARFWLFPTYAHQHAEGMKTDSHHLLKEAEAYRPNTGSIRLSHFAEVSGVYYVRRLEDALALDQFHSWSEETVRHRFAYRSPGIYVLPTRVYRVPAPFDLVSKPEYDGCKTWVELDQDLPTAGATPVIEARPYADFLEALDQLLNPTALA